MRASRVVPIGGVLETGDPGPRGRPSSSTGVILAVGEAAPTARNAS